VSVETFNGAAIVQAILFQCLRDEDRKMLQTLVTFPEFVARHEWLGRNPEPRHCDWMDFNDRLYVDGLQLCHLTAYRPAPGFSYRNTPEDHERCQRLTMLFGIPTYVSDYSWGESLMWTLSFREVSLFSGLAAWIEEQKAVLATKPTTGETSPG
jgi:hypothetical protein